MVGQVTFITRLVRVVGVVANLVNRDHFQRGTQTPSGYLA